MFGQLTCKQKRTLMWMMRESAHRCFTKARIRYDTEDDEGGTDMYQMGCEIDDLASKLFYALYPRYARD